MFWRGRRKKKGVEWLVDTFWGIFTLKQLHPGHGGSLLEQQHTNPMVLSFDCLLYPSCSVGIYQQDDSLYQKSCNVMHAVPQNNALAIFLPLINPSINQIKKQSSKSFQKLNFRQNHLSNANQPLQVIQGIRNMFISIFTT